MIDVQTVMAEWMPGTEDGCIEVALNPVGASAMMLAMAQEIERLNGLVEDFQRGWINGDDLKTRFSVTRYPLVFQDDLWANVGGGNDNQA